MKIGLPRHLSALFFISILTLIIYHNIFQAPFVLDDAVDIVDNSQIRSLSNFFPFTSLLGPRAIVRFTFALNYQFGKLNVFGYHLVNVLIHIISGFIVYFLAQTTVMHLSNPCVRYFRRAENSDKKTQGKKPQTPRPKRRTDNLVIRTSGVFLPDPFQSTIDNRQSSIYLISLVTALIFIAHPIQTQAVTYTVQRCTSMAAMFYLASVLFYLKARMGQGIEVRQRRILQSSVFFMLCIVCAMLAFLSKQNAASLPLIILLVEYMFFDQTWRGWKRKLIWLTPVLVLFGFFVLYALGLLQSEFDVSKWLRDVSEKTIETDRIGRWAYLCTQFNVIVLYVRLLFLPMGQNLDHLYPFKSGFFDGLTPLAFVFLVAMVALGIWNIKRRPVLAFGIFWFFITLSVESSLIPIRDALFEHRLYLPMFGFALCVSYQLFSFLFNKRSLALVLSILIVLSFGFATYLRNKIWQNEIRLWSDVALKSFRNPRAQCNLGDALYKEGRMEEAVGHYLQALRIKPDYEQAYNNLGFALEKQDRTDEAIKYYLEALRIKPDFAKAHYNLGVALNKQGRTDEAIKHFLEALRIKPDFAEAHYDLGFALDMQGRTEEAIEQYVQTLGIKPDFVEAHYNLGCHTLNSEGRTDEAISHFLEALRIKPDFAEAHYNLGFALEKQGRTEEAVKHYLEALQIKPDYDQAYNKLAIILFRKGNIEGAVTYFQKALSINPENINARRNLNKLLMMKQGK